MTRLSAKPRYSAMRLLREGLSSQKGWRPAWRTVEPKHAYEIVVIGGGGQGLSTAYYLAHNHGMRNVAVLEKGWIGGGNTGRNTTVVRSNYFYPQSAALYDESLRLYEGLSREINYNIMLSQRGMIEVFHSQAEMEMMARMVNAMRINGIDVDLIDRESVLDMVPALNRSLNTRWPVQGGMIQHRAGIARHDAVAWGYARAADSYGIDIIQGCEAIGFKIDRGRIKGVETNLGFIGADCVGLAAAGHSSVLAALAGFDLPLQSYTLQAMVSEPIKPCLDTVLASMTMGVYLSQSDKGELVIGGALDRLPSYAQRGLFATTQSVIAGVLELCPSFATLKLMRQWGGIVDVAPDSSPIIGPSPIDGLYLNCGWGTGGFKAIPVGGMLHAHLLATGEHHRLSAPFDLARFATGALVDEAASAGIAH